MVCDIGRKGKTRTFEPHVLLGYYIQEVILHLVMVILGFLAIPWLGPKDMEPHAPSVPKAKLGYSDCLWTVLEFCTFSGGLENKISFYQG